MQPELKKAVARGQAGFEKRIKELEARAEMAEGVVVKEHIEALDAIFREAVQKRRADKAEADANGLQIKLDKAHDEYARKAGMYAAAESERDRLRELIQQHTDGLITSGELHEYGITRPKAAQASQSQPTKKLDPCPGCGRGVEWREYRKDGIGLYIQAHRVTDIAWVDCLGPQPEAREG